MNLFIIGNGFDLQHGLPTRYSDFMNFVKSKFPYVYTWFIKSVKEYSLLYWNLVDKVDEDYIWNDLENILGSFEMSELIEQLNNCDNQEEYSELPSDEIQRLLQFGFNVNVYLDEWMKVVKSYVASAAPRPEIQRLFLKPNEILTFNYTRTLENAYNQNHALHIHGIEGEKLIMGHGEECSFELSIDNEADSANKKYVQNYICKTGKDTNKIIEINCRFFSKENLEDISVIYVLGHSLNNIDIPYIEQIFKFISSKIRWKVVYYKVDDIRKYKEALLKVGVQRKYIEFLSWSEL